MDVLRNWVADPRSIHWVEPTDFKEVPSRSHLKCEVMAFSGNLGLDFQF